MRIAYLSPFSNDSNRTIEIHKKLLASAGFVVMPLSFRTILSGQVIGLFSSKNVALLHWIELRCFKTKASGGMRWSVIGSAIWLFYFVIMALSRARVVYFIHDHAVHDTVGVKRKISSWLIRKFAGIADCRVVHDPSFCEKYRATYLPHPLYWDETKADFPLANTNNNGEMKFGVVGAVRPYKNIDNLLQVWPQGTSLLIRGRAEATYADYLRRMIDSKGLSESVEFDSVFMTDAKFVETLLSIDVLILPHQFDSMLVSGAFFEAIGRVPVILARASPFITWVASRIDSVVPFSDEREIPELLVKIRLSISQCDLSSAREFAIAEFGAARCIEVYRELLRLN